MTDIQAFVTRNGTIWCALRSIGRVLHVRWLSLAGVAQVQVRSEGGRIIFDEAPVKGAWVLEVWERDEND